MFPYIFFGGFIGWLQGFLIKDNDMVDIDSSVRKYSDGSVVDGLLLTVLKVNEGFGSSAVEKAYPLKGESGYTIGYGTKFLYTSSGSNFRNNARVLVNDTLSSLKSSMGYGSLSSEGFAKQLITNHIKFDYNFNKGGAKNFFGTLDSAGVFYSRDINVALIDIGYM
ncbi:hypothetical protein, partial [Kaistella sp.]|uniref:hypothetical protein n=1 Tax=Kaistella sp. TaxID=2782235 RepID=UPI003C5DE51A